MQRFFLVIRPGFLMDTLVPTLLVQYWYSSLYTWYTCINSTYNPYTNLYDTVTFLYHMHLVCIAYQVQGTRMLLLIFKIASDCEHPSSPPACNWQRVAHQSAPPRGKASAGTESVVLSA